MYLTTRYLNQRTEEGFIVNENLTDSLYTKNHHPSEYIKEKKLKIGRYFISSHHFKLDKPTLITLEPSNNGILMIFILDGEYFYTHHTIRKIKSQPYQLELPSCQETTKYLSILIPTEIMTALKEELFIDFKFSDLPKEIRLNDILSNSGLLSAEMMSVIIDIDTCQRKGSFKQAYLERKIAELLFLQLEIITTNKTNPTYISEIDIERMYQAREFIIQNISSPCSLANLAKQIGTNEFKLKKYFKEIFGTTVFGYINDYKMNKAKERLQNSYITITELAYELGYKSQNHFSTAFKKHFSYPPSEVKKNKQHMTSSLKDTIKLILLFITEIIETYEAIMFTSLIA